MSVSHPLPPKKEVALALLERSSVHIHLDPRAPGVVVPAWFKKQPQLVLQIGLNMPVPIPDLRLDDAGMSCTLSFNRSPFFCVVPWAGVYAMVGDDGRGMVWPEDVPPEVAQQTRDPAAAKKQQSPRRLSDETSAERDRSEGNLRDVTAKSKKPRKRPRIVPDPEPESRGGLVAVRPSDSGKRPPAAVPVPALAQKAPAEPALRRPSSPSNGGSRPKRELPPYLRVVK